MTQHDKILRYLETHERITPMIAFAELGITKLATRISEMQRLGYHFDKTMIREKRGKKTICYMSYKLVA